MDYISGLVNAMERAVVSDDGVNPESGMSFTEYIDMRSFAQKYIVEELTKNNGGGATSSFFYKPRDGVSPKLFAGPVWDYDKAYANLDGINESTGDLCYLMQRGTDPTTLFWRLNGHPEFRQMVSVCYGEFFADYMETIQDEKIDEYTSEISVSKDMDLIRWKEIYGGQVDYDREVQRIRDFLSARKPFLDEVWTEGREVCTVCFCAEEGDVRNYMSVIKGTCMERLPGDVPGTGYLMDGIRRTAHILTARRRLWKTLWYMKGAMKSQGQMEIEKGKLCLSLRLIYFGSARRRWAEQNFISEICWMVSCGLRSRFIFI